MRFWHPALVRVNGLERSALETFNFQHPTLTLNAALTHKPKESYSGPREGPATCPERSALVTFIFTVDLDLLATLTPKRRNLTLVPENVATKGWPQVE